MKIHIISPCNGCACLLLLFLFVDYRVLCYIIFVVVVFFNVSVSLLYSFTWMIMFILWLIGIILFTPINEITYFSIVLYIISTHVWYLKNIYLFIVRSVLNCSCIDVFILIVFSVVEGARNFVLRWKVHMIKFQIITCAFRID